MKIIIEGTVSEIENAKSAIDTICIFNSEFCKTDLSCDKCCEQHMQIEYKEINPFKID